MGGASTGGGGGGVGPAGVRVSKKGVKTYGTAKDAKKVSNRNETRKAVKEFVEGGGVTGAIVKGISNQIKKSKEKRVERKVNDTLIGTSDYQGDVAKKPAAPMFNPDRDGDNNNVYKPGPKTPIDARRIPKTDKNVVTEAPTKVEVSQSAAADADADADADDIYTRKRKTKARGRSMMTLTSAQGVKDNKLTLGKPSLLGS